jgi:hypothetical protein
MKAHRPSQRRHELDRPNTSVSEQLSLLLDHLTPIPAEERVGCPVFPLQDSRTQLTCGVGKTQTFLKEINNALPIDWG